MKDVSPAAAYASLMPLLVESARTAGYALAPHGSMARDFDLIAVPWTEEAASAEDLILRLIAASGGHLTPCALVAEHANKHALANEKPHGRRAWSIHLGHQLYLDVSVMPRLAPAAHPSAQPGATPAQRDGAGRPEAPCETKASPEVLP